MRNYLTILLAVLATNSVFCQTVNFTSSNLPIIVINTGGQSILDDPKITADMGIIYNTSGQRNNLTDSYNHYSGKIGIETRGQSSQMFPMKSYGLELRDTAGNSQEKSLFGMPKESDWILYAPYTDKTLMRNFLAYTMSAQMGRWASHCRFVELVVNGDYRGIYVFMEKIKRGSGRVPISKLNTDDISGDAVTGGYIFSLDKNPNAWYSSYATPLAGQIPRFSYVYPKPENIVPAQAAYIKKYVDSFETALSSGYFQDTARGVRKFADLGSFIDYLIVNEISRNVDGYRLSSFFYKDRQSKNGKIVAGPVWDYDLAFRNADYCNGSDTAGWAYNFNSICPADGAGTVPFWWSQLLADTAFAADLRCRWKSLRSGILSNSSVNRTIDSVANLVQEAKQRHFARWLVLGHYIWPNPNPIPNTYEEEIDMLKDWLAHRLNWLDGHWPNTGKCYDYPATASQSISINLNPNPVGAQQARVTINSRSGQTVNLRVFDITGRALFSSTYPVNAGANTIFLPSSGWPTGVYVISVRTADGEQLVSRFVHH